MKNIRSNAKQIIEEQYKMYLHGELSLKDYVKSEAENDPNFFRWLFDEEFDNDFDSSISEEQRNAYNEFIEKL